MPVKYIVILVLYCCLMLALILLKAFKIGNRRRGAVKMFASLTFVAVGVLGCIGGETLNIMLIVGLAFASFGDLFLVFMDKRHWFIAGVLSFSLASLTLSVYSVLRFGWQWWSVLLFVVLVVASVLAQVFNVYNYGSCKIYLNVYTVFLSACASLGFSLLCQGVSHLPMFLFGLGTFLYFLSDVCLGLFMFKFHNRAVDAINSALYFSGMMIVALSLVV